jgi:hypothetical protein
MMRTMRTTVTLDKDVERMLRNAMHRTRRSFKEVLNATLRTGLRGIPVPDQRPEFVVKPQALGLRAGIDPTSLNKIADDLEADAFREKSAHAAGA